MKRLFLFISILGLCIGYMYAQKQSKAKTKVKVVVVEKTPEEKLYEELLPATAKVMFIDSIVVDKADFLYKVNIPANLGKLIDDQQKNCYTNEFGNAAIYAQGDTLSGRHLYIAHKYGNKWEEPQLISELQNKFPDYPFLMADGVTLYFSAEGDGSVGGKDIFRTVFNTDESHFYEATNMGLPYNSPANEYMMAISDFDNIGWLVSDRYQPEGKVCIYIFEPSAQRKTFAENTDEETLKRYAKLESIKSTWQFGNRDAALSRVSAMLSRGHKRNENEKMEFIVNDHKTYTSLSDFKTQNAKKLYQELIKDKEKMSQLKTLLESARENYSQTTKTKQFDIGRQIVELENEINAIETNTHNQEKEIRKLETK